jgi:ATP synthase I chain
VAQDAFPNEDWYAGALQRVKRFMTAVGMLALVTAITMFGWRMAVGFALGGLIAYINFRWLEKGVARLGELTVEAGTPASRRGIMHRFLRQYLLLAVIAFVILSVSRESVYGLFAGLFLPVAAMLCEAAYESYKVLNG